MMECRDSEACDLKGDRTLFGQASKGAEGMGATLRSTETPLKVSYVGEEGIDAGGLYRDFLDCICAELLSSNLALLMPTPNQQDNAGKNREAWQVSPKPMTHATQRMFSFLGQLMGICLRRADVLPL